MAYWLKYVIISGKTTEGRYN